MPLGRLISRYFIPFDVIVNGILNFSDNSMFMYRNEIDFYMLILYPALSGRLFTAAPPGKPMVHP